MIPNEFDVAAKTLRDHPILLEVVLLYYRDGLTQQNVGKVMRMSQPTIHRRLRLALAILKESPILTNISLLTELSE